MTDPREFYAWVKLVCDEDDAPVLPRCDAEQEKCSCCSEYAPGGGRFRSGDRPPHAVATNPLRRPDPLEDCGASGDLFECCDAHHLRLFALPRCWGEWRVDPTYSGQQGQSFEALQFIGGRQAAIDWLNSAEGRRWRSNARQVTLLKFTGPNEKKGSGDEVVVHDVPRYASLHAWKGCAPFPLDSWRCDYKALALGRSSVDDKGGTLWTEEVARLAGELHDLVEAHPDDDCEAMRKAVEAHQAGRYDEIRAQSSDIGALKAVMARHDDLLDRPATLALLDLVRTEVLRLVFPLKWLFGRNRPWECCPDLPLAIQSGEPLFPAHAAFPAGHAMLAYTLAGLVALLWPHGPHKARAARVAENRVIAGLHWPQDIEAGRILGELLAARLAERDDVKGLLKDILAEWN